MADKVKEIQERYNNGWVTKPQLHKYVELGVLTPAQYKSICGETYKA